MAMNKPAPRAGARALGIALCAFLAFLIFPSGCGATAHLKVGTLPVIDTLPVRLATQKPIFTENDLAVDIIYFEASSRLRDALANGEVDAIITDLAGAVLFHEKQAGARIVRVAMRASPNRPMFALVAPGQYSAVRNLENARIAVANEYQDRYIADRLLEAEGVSRWTMVSAGSPEAGLELLGRGEVAAALIPQALISSATSAGFHITTDDRNLALGQTVVVFSEHTVTQKPAFIRRFIRAYEQAARELNVRPEQYRTLADELVRLTPEASASFSMPVFPFPGEAPTESEIESVSTWLVAKKLLPQPVPYEDAVNIWFLWDPYQFSPANCCGW